MGDHAVAPLIGFHQRHEGKRQQIYKKRNDKKDKNFIQTDLHVSKACSNFLIEYSGFPYHYSPRSTTPAGRKDDAVRLSRGREEKSSPMSILRAGSPFLSARRAARRFFWQSSTPVRNRRTELTGTFQSGGKTGQKPWEVPPLQRRRPYCRSLSSLRPRINN